MSEHPMMSSHDAKLVSAFKPEVGSAVSQALMAGIPIFQIFAWIQAHGDQIVSMIGELINLFKKKEV